MYRVRLACVLADKSAEFLDGRLAFIEPAGKDLPHMYLTFPFTQRNVDAGPGGFVGHT